MKPLPPAPAHASPLTKPIEGSSHAAHSKAQKLRTHAQEKRGFRDHLQLKQKSAEHPAKVDTAGDSGKEAGESNANETTAPAKGDVKDNASPEGSKALKSDSAPPQQERAGASRPSHEHAADEPGENAISDQPSEPFLQQIVAQVLEGVDPALKLKPTTMARAAGTVSGNASSQMRAVNVEPKPTLPAGAASAGSPDSPALVPGTDASMTASQGPAAPSAHGEPPEDAPASAPSEPAKTAAAPAAPGGTNASSAVASAATALSPAMVPIRGGEQRLTLTQTAAGPSIGTVGAGAPSASMQTASKPSPLLPPPPPLAQQVQQGLEVAMHDLPAPAGERLVTIRLNPSSLGSLRIALHVSGDAVHVRFQVGSAKARASIGKSMEDLKAAIGRQGLRVESMDVEEDSALAALDAPAATENDGPAAAGDARLGSPVSGKGFAQLLNAPHGPDGPRAADATGRTPNQAEAANEDGVLQVLTFRLDAVG